MASTHSVCDLYLRLAQTASALEGLRCSPRRHALASMDTSPTPRISLALEPETMMALTLRYVEDNEAAADQYLRAMLRLLMFDLHPHEAFKLVRAFITETTNDIRDFEGEEAASRIDAALRRLIDRAEADEAFMAELTELAG